MAKLHARARWIECVEEGISAAWMSGGSESIEMGSGARCKSLSASSIAPTAVLKALPGILT
jgi:hypothetical protein